MKLNYTKQHVAGALERASTHADNVTLTSERQMAEDWLALYARAQKLERAVRNLADCLVSYCGK